MTDQAQQPQMAPQEPFQILCTEYGLPPQKGLTETSQWIHLASARFGPARASGITSTPWSGNSYEYHLFHRPDRRQFGLRWAHGGGTGWWIEHDRTRSGVHSLLKHLAAIPEESMRWDFCHKLAESLERTISATRAMEGERWQRAILEKRLKKTSRKGVRTVEIQPAPPSFLPPQAHKAS